VLLLDEHETTRVSQRDSGDGGQLHVAYLVGTDGDDVLAQYAGLGGQEDLAAIQYGHSNIAVAVDKTNVPYVAYSDPDSGAVANTRLKILKRRGAGAWVEVPPMQASDQVWDFGFAIGKDDSLHLAFADGDSQAANRTVRYVHRAGFSAP
jgi:hypothetical protein